MRQTFEVFEIREGGLKRVTLVTCESEETARELAKKMLGGEWFGVREHSTLGMLSRTQ